MKEISREKLEWLKEIGAREFEEPMKYSVGVNWLYSEKHIIETPLEELKARYNQRLIKGGLKMKEISREDLEKRVEVLEKKVAELEKEVQPLSLEEAAETIMKAHKANKPLPKGN